MQKVLNLYKKLGETPLERLDRLRAEKSEYRDLKLTYAGRLDPMAEGVLLVLAGEENKEREKYLSLDKEYLFEVLRGFSTDSFDILGIPRLSQTLNSNPPAGGRNSEQFIDSKFKKILENYQGKITQKYPPYSSKPVLGKPLFQWAREGRLEEIETPERKVEIYSINLEESYSISKKKLEEQIKEKVMLVKGDFRQEEILKSWREAFKETLKEEFLISRIKVSASSGFYVRILADELGEKLGTGALAFKIVRTKVGDFYIEDSV